MDRSAGDGRLTGSTAEHPSDPVSRSCELGDVSFGAVLDVDGTPRVQWATPDGLELVGCGIARRFTATGRQRFARVRARADDYFASLEHDGPAASRPRAIGGLSFHDGHEPSEPWGGFEAASFVVPRVQVTRTDEGDDAAEQAGAKERGTWLTVVGEDATAAAEDLEYWRDRLAELPAMRPSGTGPGVAATTRPTTREAWTRQVETALERIESGALEKVVLAQTLEVELAGSDLDVAATLERLRRQYPNCYRFLVDQSEGGTFFGAPPERLVSMDGDRVETEALAGSVPRGETPEEDDELVERMVGSEKFQQEHGLVVEAIRDGLESLSASVTVGEQTIRRLATIQHLQTPIEATLVGDDDRHVLEIVEALHPTPAVGGLPPDAAWETIREIETFDRGWYASPIGWFDAAGDGEFAVGLRSGLVTGQRVTLFSGNGIVADSDPDDEWDEIQLKFRPVLDELR
ncbi:isochorismate synthase [Halobacteria archaeon AArc-m2/3/4]|uniref:isochorismate synthase n=1 Tax=Natronoglomus mannanivorans TaxID=2979990 RepID=A0ABT2Q8P8_9EURY|nr:isochorismate synthase [Halobacteria archaeon AArc-m2/3/4]